MNSMQQHSGTGSWDQWWQWKSIKTDNENLGLNTCFSLEISLFFFFTVGLNHLKENFGGQICFLMVRTTQNISTPVCAAVHYIPPLTSTVIPVNTSRQHVRGELRPKTLSMSAKFNKPWQTWWDMKTRRTVQLAGTVGVLSFQRNTLNSDVIQMMKRFDFIHVNPVMLICTDFNLRMSPSLPW